MKNIFSPDMDKSFAYQHDFPPTAAYKNLNLNQTNSVSSKFVVKETQNVSISIKKNEKQFYMSLTKTNKLNNIDTAANKTPFHHSAISELFEKKLFLTSKDSKSRSSAHGNTLSLHICAYENSNEYVDLEWIPLKQRTDIESKLKKERKLLFEIPRHPSKEKSGDPEISNFKASQKLLNPNKVAENKYSDDNMFSLVFNGLKMSNLSVIPLPEIPFNSMNH